MDRVEACRFFHCLLDAPTQRPHLKSVEVAQARQAPVHVLHHGHEHKLHAEYVHVARPALYLDVRLLTSRSSNKAAGTVMGVVGSRRAKCNTIRIYFVLAGFMHHTRSTFACGRQQQNMNETNEESTTKAWRLISRWIEKTVRIYSEKVLMNQSFHW